MHVPNGNSNIEIVIWNVAEQCFTILKQYILYPLSSQMMHIDIIYLYVYPKTKRLYPLITILIVYLFSDNI